MYIRFTFEAINVYYVVVTGEESTISYTDRRTVDKTKGEWIYNIDNDVNILGYPIGCGLDTAV